MDNEMLDSYKAYIQTQCSFYSPNTPEFLSGEILHLWFQRKSLRREMASQETELSRIDGVLSGLMFDQKKRLSRIGRNGGWSRWLEAHRIPRSTADRLALEHVEFFGLQHELPHREQVEPLEGRISQAAHRASDRHEQMLKSPRSRIMFLSCLADRFGLSVDFGEDGSVRLYTPPPVDENQWESEPVPNVIEMQENGMPRPIDYELKADEGEGSLPL